MLACAATALAALTPIAGLIPHYLYLYLQCLEQFKQKNVHIILIAQTAKHNIAAERNAAVKSIKYTT